MRQPDPSNVSWIKSSYSGDNGGNCLEIAAGFAGWVPVRDSKAPEGPAVVFGRCAWDSFVRSV